MPLRGTSALSAPDGPFHDPEADAALFGSLRSWMSPAVEVVELDLHINDSAFAAACAEKLLGMMKKD